MFIVENLTNSSVFDAPEWATTPELAMQAAAATVAVAVGNLKLDGSPEHFTLTNSRGATQAYRVITHPFFQPYCDGPADARWREEQH